MCLRVHMLFIPGHYQTQLLSESLSSSRLALSKACPINCTRQNTKHSAKSRITIVSGGPRRPQALKNVINMLLAMGAPDLSTNPTPLRFPWQEQEGTPTSAPIGSFLKCISMEEASKLLADVHKGECGSHSKAQTLAQKTICHGLYQSTALVDVAQLVKSCKA